MALVLLLLSAFMIITRCFSQGRPVAEVKVIAPPPMNTMEQLLAVQNAVTQVEQLIQDGNIILLKFRGLLLSIFPQGFSHSLLLVCTSCPERSLNALLRKLFKKFIQYQLLTFVTHINTCSLDVMIRPQRSWPLLFYQQPWLWLSYHVNT